MCDESMPQGQMRSTYLIRIRQPRFQGIRLRTFGLYLGCGRCNGSFDMFFDTHISKRRVNRIVPYVER